MNKDKEALRVAALITLALVLVWNAFYWLFVYDNADDVLDMDEFEKLATIHIPSTVEIPPLSVSAYPQASPCSAQDHLVEHGLAVAASNDGQGLYLRLFDSSETAIQFVEGMQACWAETGSTTIETVDKVSLNGVEIYVMGLDNNAPNSTAYVAVYRNVYMYTTLETMWQPWTQVASGHLKEAIDKANEG